MTKRKQSEDHLTFVCACCRTRHCGEIPLLQHAKSKRHRHALRGRPFLLLPNSSGIVPELSSQAQAELGLGNSGELHAETKAQTKAERKAQAKALGKFRAEAKGRRGSRKDNEIFVCGYCRVEMTGEVSLLSHWRGAKHLATSQGGPLHLVANRDGVVPELSSQVLAELIAVPRQTGKGSPGTGSAHSQGQSKKAKLGTQTSAPQELQRLDLCEKSAALLKAALDTSEGLATAATDTNDGEMDKQNRPAEQAGTSGDAAKTPARRKREAIIPKQALGNPSLKPMREALPVLEHRSKILQAIQRHQVIIVEGETGCGKTTQVAQYIVEDAAEARKPCSVVCTQPRRISAISVAERVADERGERLGGSVGYSVRLDNKVGPCTCLLFCTTGILLRRLECDADLEGTTHVVVDEVHERGVESDFLLLALRDLCQRRQDLKVILMSATMDKDLFGRYFNGAPALTVPGRTFPVEDFFVEDALQATGHVLDTSAEWSLGGGKGKGKGKSSETGERQHLDAPKRQDLSDAAVRSHYKQFSARVQTALRSMEQDAVNFALLVELLQKDTLTRLSQNQNNGRPCGVLIFMSGAKEIEMLQEALWRVEEFRGQPARSWVLPLHGGLPMDEQKKVFQRPPQGVRKVVISTNVAETAVTIDDIGYVVDTCRMKEMRYDALRCMSSLEDTVVSRTNARQRRGRAGRVAPGLCVHVGLTRYRHDHLIDDHQPPEVQRTPLEQLILRIHATGLHLRDPSGKAGKVCTRLLEPPNPAFVEKAVKQLVGLGALELEPHTGRERLTALGQHLARLPVEVRLGKLVLLGAAFGPAATDAALTVAAALTSRNPFLAPLECREEAAKAKRSFAERMAVKSVGLSDHLAVLAAYREWDAIEPKGESRYEFCRANFLSIKTLQGMSELKRSLLETLSGAGFVQRKLQAKEVSWRGRKHNGSDGVLLALSAGSMPEPCPPVLVAALLCAALFPQVAEARMPQGSTAKRPKPDSDVNRPKPRLLVRDAENGKPVKVRMHPGSVSAQEATLSSPYLIYQELVKTTVLYVRDVTPVPPLALVLFGGCLAKGSSKACKEELVVDGWFRLAVPTDLQTPLLETRRRLDVFFSGWVGRSRTGGDACPEKESTAELLRLIVQLLSIQEECAPPAALAQQKPQRPKEQAKQKAHARQRSKGKGRGFGSTSAVSEGSKEQPGSEGASRPAEQRPSESTESAGAHGRKAKKRPASALGNPGGAPSKKKRT